MEENASKQKKRSLNKNNKKSLPWLVELLFVQIGLPETLLINYLSLEKKAKKHIEEKSNRYKLIFLIGFFLIYIYPIIQESKHKNICITSISSTNKNKVTSPIEKAKAVHYCNGGVMESIQRPKK